MEIMIFSFALCNLCMTNRTDFRGSRTQNAINTLHADLSIWGRIPRVPMGKKPGGKKVYVSRAAFLAAFKYFSDPFSTTLAEASMNFAETLSRKGKMEQYANVVEQYITFTEHYD